MSAPSPEPAGQLLRAWRQKRGKSQLDLALEADVSTRHISFLETGRSNPSRDMIVHLCEVLEVPLRERNRILESAGFARLYSATPLEDPSLEQVSRVIDLLLEAQHPAGAIAIDWDWNVLRANRSMTVVSALFVEPEVLAEAPLNAMRLVFHEKGMHRWVANWDEFAPSMIARIRREADHTGRPEAAALLDELLESPAVAREWRQPGADVPPLLMPMKLRRDAIELELFSTITTLGTPHDVTLQELRIESFFPMNAASEATLRALTDGAGAQTGGSA